MISCLCVTRGDRLGLLAQAVADFAHQTHAPRELVVVHDGGGSSHDAMLALAASHPQAVIRVVQVAPGFRLGGLRNQAVAAAQGAWVCQWDDDDRYHPERLALQWQAVLRDRAAVGYLVDQLHWFTADSTLCWDDWEGEPYPMNLIQGTILARRDVMPAYPDLARGEDTAHTHKLLRAAAAQGFGVSRLRGAGWCYVYRHHGANVWHDAHHRAISATKHLRAALLLPRLATLRARLAEYSPQLPGLQMKLGGQRQPVWLQA